jgi:serine/threonine-protein kinase
MRSTPKIGHGQTIELGYGRVVVDARVGEGAMGSVWRGWLFYAPGGPRASEPPIPIALKELHPTAVAQKPILQFFLNEAEALRRLAHPNIVRFYDMIETEHSLAICMEFVDGNTLEEVIARSVARARLAGPGALPGMPFARAWYYFQQLLGALAATHELGIVHRDVKPANVLVRRDGIVKLGDFGIARLASTPDPSFGSESGAIAPGTGAYMSPEQVMARGVDGRSDLYSAGIVLYEMLTGRLPFLTEGKSELALRLEQLDAQPPPIRTFFAQAPPVLDALFVRSLAKDPNLRFSSAIEMGDAFRSALGMPDTPAWRAQGELARKAPTTILDEPPAAEAVAVQTLRNEVVRGYAKTQLGI